MELVQKIPILTTVIAAGFLFIILNHLKKKPDAKYLQWWALGVFCYGLGTLIESCVSIFGWSPFLFKSWYIAGALLGGAPLAQGTVYLVMKEKIADKLSIALILVIVSTSILVILSPLDLSKSEAFRLSGSVLEWQWIRGITPFINIYAFIFLVGGAIYSAWRYSKNPIYKNRAWGNILIAIGGILPGIGGSFSKFGHTEVLYVTELHGIILIIFGYMIIRNDQSLSIYEVQRT